MSTEAVIQIVTNVVVALIFLGAIPWAMKIVRELTEIKTTLENQSWQATAIDELRGKVQKIELQLAVIGMGDA